MNSIATPVSTAQSGVEETSFRPTYRELVRARLAAYSQLAKPRIAIMVLFAVTVGYLLASQGGYHLKPLLHTCVGVFLAIVASSSFNQLVERNTDRLMTRTQNRPLPSERLTSLEVFLIASVCTVISFAYLIVFVNALTAWLTLATTFLYAACYTPLKRYTPFCTVVGAVPGALPPVLGWTAAGGQLDWGAFSLFAILFVWQFPHFLAIAWIYRDQYENAGLYMIPGRGRPGIIGVVAFAYSLVLIPVSLLPVRLGLSGDIYGTVAVILGLWYAWSSFRFQQEESLARARSVLWISFAYLPGVMFILTLDHLRLML
ncbi:heme o synthase [Planctomicrobium sp. SH668]|uniref:heme o synthase n=1 Tax=Planctomicrobium sp. SH668 TaxID=3448126 RepID=UPI003F5C8756